MASSRKTSGLRLYNLLRKEAGAINKELKKPLSPEKLKKFIKDKLYPSWKENPVSRIRKGDLRQNIKNRLVAAGRKKNNAGKLYNLLLHETTELNKSLPEQQQLNIKKRREFISQFIYPKYKGQNVRKISRVELRRFIAAEFRKNKKDVCDVLAIEPNIYQAINYFDIDDFISMVMPPCIFMEVNAGDWGRTDIFNTKDYDYYSSGVQGITNNLNRAVQNRELPIDTDVNPKYYGEVQLRPGKKNDGNPENYYLQMYLVLDDQPVEEPEYLKVPKRKKSNRQKKIVQNTRQYINERTKKLEKEKSRVKSIRRHVAQLEYDLKKQQKLFSKLVKQGLIKDNVQKKFNENSYKAEKARLDKFKKEKVIEQYVYQELIKKLKSIFKQ